MGLARSETTVQKLESRHIRVCKGDLHNPESIAQAADQADAVIHTAATNDADMPRTEKMAVEAIVKALDGTGKSFIYTTGTWLVGNTGDRVADENSPLDPTPLIAWRAEIEPLVLGSQERNIRTIVIRPALVYGRGGGIIAMLVQSGCQYGVVQFVGSGENRWTLIHVEDLARCYVAALKHSPAGTLLIASDNRIMRLRDIAQAASFAAGVPGQTQSLPLDEARNRMGLFADALALDQQVSAAKARQLLNWIPQAPSLLEELKQGSYRQ